MHVGLKINPTCGLIPAAGTVRDRNRTAPGGILDDGRGASRGDWDAPIGERKWPVEAITELNGGEGL